MESVVSGSRQGEQAGDECTVEPVEAYRSRRWRSRTEVGLVGQTRPGRGYWSYPHLPQLLTGAHPAVEQRLSEHQQLPSITHRAAQPSVSWWRIINQIAPS